MLELDFSSSEDVRNDHVRSQYEVWTIFRIFVDVVHCIFVNSLNDLLTF